MTGTMKMEYKIGINAPLISREAKTLMVEGDRCANTIVIEVMDGNDPADLAGCSASAYMIRPDGNKPFVKGTVEGNIVKVCLNEAFYAAPGRYNLFVRLTHTDGTKRTLLWLNGWIADEGQGDVIDTENVVPSLDDLLAQIEAMEQGTAEAKAAAASVEGFKAEINDQVGQLSEENDGLSEKVDESLLDGRIYFNKALFVPGMFASDGSISTRWLYRAITPKAISFPENRIVKCADGYRFMVLYYTSDGTFESSSGWIQQRTEYTIPANTNVKLQISAMGEDINSTADIDVFYRQLYTAMPNYNADEIRGVSRKIDALVYDGEVLLEKGLWTTGSFNSDGTIHSSLNCRAITRNIIAFDHDMTLRTKEGFRLTVLNFDNDGNFTSITPWIPSDESYTIAAKQNVKLQIARNASVEDYNSTADVDLFFSQLYAETPLIEKSSVLLDIQSATWAATGSPIYTINTDGNIRVENTKTSGYHYISTIISLNGVDSVTVKYDEIETTADAWLRIGKLRESGGSEWDWIAGVGANKASLINTTGWPGMVIALYSCRNSTTEIGTYTLYKGVSVVKGSAHDGYSGITAVDKQARAAVDFQAKRLRVNNLFYAIAHRGGHPGLTSGENALSAIEETCKRGGINWMELDVRFSADGFPMLCHLDVNSASLGVFTDLEGNAVDVTISAHTKDELVNNYKYMGETIGTFEQGCEICKRYGISIMIDKAVYFTADNLRVMMDIVKRYRMQDHVVWVNLNAENYATLLAWHSKSKLWFDANAAIIAGDVSGLEAISAAHPDAQIWVGVNATEQDDDTIKAISMSLPTSMKLVLFTVNDRTRFAGVAPFVDGIVTDFFVSSDIVGN